VEQQSNQQNSPYLINNNPLDPRLWKADYLHSDTLRTYQQSAGQLASAAVQRVRVRQELPMGDYKSFVQVGAQAHWKLVFVNGQSQFVRPAGLYNL